MRSAVVIILVIALTILLFEEALSRISRTKLKTKVKNMRISKPKLKTTRTKHIRHKVHGKPKPKTVKKPGASTAVSHTHHGFGGGTGLYAAQVGVEAVSSLGTTGSNIAQTVLQKKASEAENEGEGQGQENGGETS
ncbi:hypothetical protein MTO96_044287 [Rhipicephalus appendiculatus]|uniref:Glycine rich superfamily member n=1 Tax=Rhipicephalus appendiculatus TaxID=34631 RepID=A0A131YEC2_RHIAP